MRTQAAQLRGGQHFQHTIVRIRSRFKLFKIRNGCVLATRQALLTGTHERQIIVILRSHREHERRVTAREIHQHRDVSQFVPHLLVLLAQQFHIRQIGGVKRGKHALAGDFVEADGRDADGFALQILTGYVAVAGIAVQCDRNQIIIRVIADEINDDHAILAACLAQTTAELLRENDARLRLTQHHDLIDVWNIHAFIEQVDGENIVQFAVLQLCHGSVAFHLRIFAGDGFRAVWPFRLLVHLLVEQVGQSFRFLASAAEHQTLHGCSGLAVDLYLVDDVAHGSASSSSQRLSSLRSWSVIDSTLTSLPAIFSSGAS